MQAPSGPSFYPDARAVQLLDCYVKMIPQTIVKAQFDYVYRAVHVPASQAATEPIKTLTAFFGFVEYGQRQPFLEFCPQKEVVRNPINRMWIYKVKVCGRLFARENYSKKLAKRDVSASAMAWMWPHLLSIWRLLYGNPGSCCIPKESSVRLENVPERTSFQSSASASSAQQNAVVSSTSPSASTHDAEVPEVPAEVPEVLETQPIPVKPTEPAPARWKPPARKTVECPPVRVQRQPPPSGPRLRMSAEDAAKPRPTLNALRKLLQVDSEIVTPLGRPNRLVGNVGPVPAALIQTSRPILPLVSVSPTRTLAVQKSEKTVLPTARSAKYVLGEVSGDISKGVNIFPIPCYNFENNASFSDDLIYLNEVVQSNSYEDHPALSPYAEFPTPCLTGDDFSNCESTRCPCMAYKLCPKKRSTRYCSECQLDGGYHYLSPVVDDCFFIIREGVGPISTPASLSKPNPSLADVQRLKTRLLKKSVLFSDLKPDLTALINLIDREMALLDVSGVISKFSSDFSNSMDLFDEIERLAFGEPVKTAVVRFELSHPFSRWDLSVCLEKAPISHSDVAFGQFSRSGVLGEDMSAMEALPLTGCSADCQCPPDCPNRIWQRPSTARLALVYVNEVVQWGVVALGWIRRGQFVTEYTGELARGQLYDDDSYLYELNVETLPTPPVTSKPNRKRQKTVSQTASDWVVDARKKGNISRFFNHSCRPNLRTVELHEHGTVFPRLCVIAVRTIRPGEPLTLDYGSGWWSAKQENDGIVCRCGVEECRFSQLPSSSSGDKNKITAI